MDSLSELAQDRRERDDRPNRIRLTGCLAHACPSFTCLLDHVVILQTFIAITCVVARPCYNGIMKPTKKLLVPAVVAVLALFTIIAVSILWMWQSDRWIFRGDDKTSDQNDQSEVEQDDSDLELEEVEDDEDAESETEDDNEPSPSGTADTREETDSSPPASPPAAPPAANFSDNGVLLSDAGGWVILYEEPGQPALNANLVFDANSQCDTGGGLGACNTAAFTHGTDIDVTGYLSGNNLTVHQLVYR